MANRAGHLSGRFDPGTKLGVFCSNRRPPAIVYSPNPRKDGKHRITSNPAPGTRHLTRGGGATPGSATRSSSSDLLSPPRSGLPSCAFCASLRPTHPLSASRRPTGPPADWARKFQFKIKLTSTAVGAALHPSFPCSQKHNLRSH